jgi:inorganic triphosphatase YgiF
VQEIELKFRVEAAARDGVARAVAGRTGPARVRRERLQAVYFDTAEGELAAAGIALRLRREGARWVQTLKAGTAQAMQRLEHEATVGRAAAGQPTLDVTRHAGTPAFERLRGVLAEPAAAAWIERFRTDVRRAKRPVRQRGATVEVALDEGEIHAGDRREPVCELEFELLGGSPAALVELAQRWVARHRLWLDVRSKAERGERLARGIEAGAPRKAVPVSLDAQMDAGAALQAILNSTLDQMLGNASEIAAARFDAEHVHQLRVGLRRTRSALRLFEALELDGVDGTWRERLAAVFRRLGSTRDRDVLATTLVPALREAGASWAELPPALQDAMEDPVAVVRDPATTLLWLELLGFASRDRGAPAAGEPLADQLAPRVAALHRRVLKDARRFRELDDEARHVVRKRVKRLRYAVEFSAGLFRGKRVDRYLRALRPLQDALGELGDLQLALQLYTQAAEGEPRAWFAVGWIARARLEALDGAAAALRRFARVRAFW